MLVYSDISYILIDAEKKMMNVWVLFCYPSSERNDIKTPELSISAKKLRFERRNPINTADNGELCNRPSTDHPLNWVIPLVRR